MRVVVVGAGIAGLMAAQSLSNSGHDVVVVDKGRSPGGRLATRRINDATLDHGAQFLPYENLLLNHMFQSGLHLV